MLSVSSNLEACGAHESPTWNDNALPTLSPSECKTSRHASHNRPSHLRIILIRSSTFSCIIIAHFLGSRSGQFWWCSFLPCQFAMVEPSLTCGTYIPESPHSDLISSFFDSHSFCFSCHSFLEKQSCHLLAREQRFAFSSRFFLPAALPMLRHFLTKY
jgi:hypothetical protein